jgi:hypothetical protein
MLSRISGKADAWRTAASTAGRWEVLLIVRKGTRKSAVGDEGMLRL